MKKDIHPKEYRDVIFHDNSSGHVFLIPSTIKTKETGTYTDGKTYPIAHVEISSASHPFYTGNEKLLDSAGRVEKFKSRQAKAAPKKVKEVKEVKSKKAEKEDVTEVIAEKAQ